MEFDYFYGPEDAEQYQFYRIPKLLITSERFKDVSVESKLLYGLMLDRLSLSIKNGWFDSLNRAYIIYTIEDVTEDMHCGSQKAVKLVAELEKKAGLIKKKRQGLGKPSLIYVLKFSTVCPQNTSESQFKNGENHNSGNVKITTQEFPNSQPNKTNQNQTENNDDLKQSYPYDHGRIDEILDLLVDTVCSTAKTIRCAGEDRPAEVVKSRFMKLDYGHIQYVLDCIHDNTTEVRNIKAYMLTTLYNASMTIDHYYQTKVGHDLYGYDGG